MIGYPMGYALLVLIGISRNRLTQAGEPRNRREMMSSEKLRIDTVPHRKVLMECIERGQGIARAMGVRAYSARAIIIYEIERMFNLTLKTEEVSNDHTIKNVGDRARAHN